MPENPLQMSFGENPIEKVVAVLVYSSRRSSSSRVD